MNLHHILSILSSGCLLVASLQHFQKKLGPALCRPITSILPGFSIPTNSSPSSASFLSLTITCKALLMTFMVKPFCFHQSCNTSSTLPLFNIRSCFIFIYLPRARFGPHQFKKSSGISNLKQCWFLQANCNSLLRTPELKPLSLQLTSAMWAHFS